MAASFRLSNTGAFWSLAVLLCLIQSAASAPSPLYGLYQQAWHFSPIVLTTVYAANALALLVTLLFVGSLSDHVGRRPVLLAAAVIELLAMAVFVSARDVAWLTAGRILQGIATGIASGAISAMMIDFRGASSKVPSIVTNMSASGGIALGALASGLLVQFGPAPTHLIFWLLLAGFAVLVVLTAVMPETVSPDGAWRTALRPRATVPAQVRGAFLALIPSIVACWALGGLYLSLGPSIVGTLTHSQGRLIGGLVILALNGSGVTMTLLGRDWSPERCLYAGSALLITGVTAALLALATRSTALFFAGTMVAGAGFGPSFSGALRTLTGLSPAASRAQVIAAIYVVSYLALSLPAVAAGIAVTRVGLFPTAYGYGIAVIALTAGAAFASLRHRHRATRSRETTPLSPHHDHPPCPGTIPPLLQHT
ncbi:MFS transporter [Nonomuraea sediminis]|uniref:MFS transporter n=1 Tax=Nonomuraea sediminis TaxID=2835864 RepID=UPI001BDD77E7|nr:MFS transporter [Nonomuraea sediminis]